MFVWDPGGASRFGGGRRVELGRGWCVAGRDGAERPRRGARAVFLGKREVFGGDGLCLGVRFGVGVDCRR